MKHNYKWAAALTLSLAIALTGCQKDEQPQITPDPPSPSPAPDWQEETTYSFHQSFSDTDGVTLLTVGLSAPDPALSQAQGQALESIANYYQDWLKEQTEYAQTQLLDAAGETRAFTKENETLFTPFSLECTYQIMRSDGKVFSVLRRVEEATGGVHQGESLQSESFSVVNGGLLLLDDIFAVSDLEWQPKVKSLILDQAAQREKEQPGTFFDGFADQLMEQYNRRDFYLDEQGLTLYWQVYDLGPYTSGAQLFTIPYEELTGILREEWLLDKEKK